MKIKKQQSERVQHIANNPINGLMSICFYNAEDDIFKYFKGLMLSGFFYVLFLNR
jgi:hypothetical protein